MLKYAVINRFFNIPSKEYEEIDYFNRQMLLDIARTAMMEQGLYSGMAAQMDGKQLKEMMAKVDNAYDGYVEEVNVLEKMKGFIDGNR